MSPALTLLQLLGPLGGAIIAFFSVVTASYATGRRERKNRTNVHLSRLIDKRYDLYVEYMDILDTNADVLLGDTTLSEREITVSQLLSLERRMKVYASNDVLEAFEFYRDCMRQLASGFEKMSNTEKSRLRYELEVSSTLALAMIRADLQIDRYDSRRQRRIRRRAVKCAMRGESENFRERALGACMS
ncbi:MAG: hypothetical protein WCF33_21560 [Pseudonocardiaceae bacterium]